jgi:hypothetical protein
MARLQLETNVDHVTDNRRDPKVLPFVISIRSRWRVERPVKVRQQSTYPDLVWLSHLQRRISLFTIHVYITGFAMVLGTKSAGHPRASRAFCPVTVSCKIGAYLHVEGKRARGRRDGA